MPQQSSVAAGVTTWEGRGGRMAKKSELEEITHKKKKVIWKGNKVEISGGNARLVYRASFAGRSS